MQKKTLLNAIFLAAPMMFSSLVFAEASTPVTAQTQQGKTADEHAGHGEHAGASISQGKGGMPGSAGKFVAWTAFPTLKIKMGGKDRESRIITVVPQSIVAGRIEAYSNDNENSKGHRQLPLDMAGARLDKPEIGGFHWLVAREEQSDTVRVASTVYFSSERGGKNPTAMLMRQKYELEIIPQPFPREHSSYRANEVWKFLVRFNSKPLANQKINLETRNGTKIELTSDTQGVVTVRLPDDFKAEARQKGAGSHDHGRRSSDFVLAAEHVEGGQTYLTGFNGSYGPDAFDKRNLAMGLGFAFLGMIGATPLLRRKEKKKIANPEQLSAAEATKKEGT